MFLIFLFAPALINFSSPVNKEDSPNIVKDFSPSIDNYLVNKTMYFEGADPYSDYTYSSASGSQSETGGVYEVLTPLNAGTQIYGYDEFSETSELIAHVEFKPTDLTGTYRLQPILYTYQKTDLTSSTHWAVAIFWYANELWLYHNTANGQAIDGVQLDTTSPIVDNVYSCLLANSGTTTLVSVYNRNTSSFVYSGNTTTVNYDASALYASFGQYSAGDGAIIAEWDYFAYVDSRVFPTWAEVGTASFFISVIIDEWGMNTALIILGLIMVPASTLYLVHGIKHDRSMDRLFYGLIIFMVGCGLFIGGVLP